MDYYGIITKLIGSIEPVGESNTDESRYENLQQMTLLVDRLIQDLRQVSEENKDRIEYSMKRIGEYATKFLKYHNIGED